MSLVSLTIFFFLAILRRRTIVDFSYQPFASQPEESVQVCMEKMLASDIRHLPLVEDGKLLGMLSIKDLVKATIKEKEEAIKVLSDFALGKGGHFSD